MEVQAAEGRSRPLSAPPRRSTWLGTSWLMLADIIGTSVLTFAGVARQLGWVPTITFIALGSPVAVYTAVLMSRTRNILVRSLGKEPLTMGEAGRIVLGGDRAAMVVYGVVYGFGFLGQSSYLLVLGQTVQGVFFESHVCLPEAIMLAAGVCLPFVVSVRHLSDSVYLCFLNLLLILAVLGIVMAQQAMDGRPEGVRTFLFAEDLTLFTMFGAMTNILFSYTGHWLYFEVMSEMTEPGHFPRVLYVNAPVQVFLYMMVACWGYYYAGDAANGYFLDNLPNGEAYRWASALLLLHVIVAFLIKNVVLARHLHSILCPSRAAIQSREPGGFRAHMEYALCAVLLMLCCCLVANAVPFFMELMGLVGGLLSAPISCVLPMVFFARAKLHSGSSSTPSRRPEAPAEEGSEARAGRPKQAPLLADSAPEPSRSGSSSAPAAAGPQAPQQLHWLDKTLFLVIGVITVLTMVAGTSDVLSRIAKMENEGPPFSCKALPQRPQ